MQNDVTIISFDQMILKCVHYVKSKIRNHSYAGSCNWKFGNT